jgi:hypothetical protein
LELGDADVAACQLLGQRLVVGLQGLQNKTSKY